MVQLSNASVATMYADGYLPVGGFHSDDCGRPAAHIDRSSLLLSGEACVGIVLKLLIGLLRLEVERGNTFQYASINLRNLFCDNLPPHNLSKDTFSNSAATDLYSKRRLE
jgi:hypothetical protein